MNGHQISPVRVIVLAYVYVVCTCLRKVLANQFIGNIVSTNQNNGYKTNAKGYRYYASTPPNQYSTNHQFNVFTNYYKTPFKKLHAYNQPKQRSFYSTARPVRRNIYAQTSPPLLYPVNEIYNQQLLSNQINSINHVIDFNWSGWTLWSKCSKSCNGGIKKRKRECKQKGKGNSYVKDVEENTTFLKCDGNNEDFRECNKMPCISKKELAKQKRSARSKQCGGYNSTPYLGETYTWVPYMRVGLEECRLNCMAVGFRMFKSFGNVLDGTICGQKKGYACTSGACVKYKEKIYHRDLKHSSKRPVPTLLRNGQSNFIKQKRHQRKYFRHNRRFFKEFNSFKLGYNPGFRISKGAKNITIYERRPSRNYLALRLGKKYILNGNWKISLSGEFSIDELTITYDIKVNEEHPLEKLHIDGPLPEDLQVEILYQQDITDIHYDYLLLGSSLERPNNFHSPPARSKLQYPQQRRGNIHNPIYLPNSFLRNKAPVNNRFLKQRFYQQATDKRFHYVISNTALKEGLIQKPRSLFYKWQIGGISRCDKRCGIGSQEFTYRCFELTDPRSGKFVDNKKCKELAKPIRKVRICNQHGCPVKWSIGQWSACSHTCGNSSVQTRQIICQQQQQYMNQSDQFVAVHGSICKSIRKPDYMRVCLLSPCFFKWYKEGWGECSSSCGQGTQIRNVFCQHHYGSKIPDDNCNTKEKPIDVRECFTGPCQVAWYASEWSMCSSACDKGHQERRVICASLVGLKVREDQCEISKKPVSKQPCKGSFCSKALWLTTEWSKCSNDCGEGFKFRNAFCVEVNNQFKQVDKSNCNHVKRPSDKKACHGDLCQPLWYSSEWNECDAVCGYGITSRKRICLSKKDERLSRGCMYNSRPVVKDKCIVKPCPTTPNHIYKTIARTQTPLSTTGTTTFIHTTKPNLIDLTQTPKHDEAQNVKKAEDKYLVSKTNENNLKTKILKTTSSHFSNIKTTPQNNTKTTSSAKSSSSKTIKMVTLPATSPRKTLTTTTYTTPILRTKPPMIRQQFRNKHIGRRISPRISLRHFRLFGNLPKQKCYLDLHSKAYCTLIAFKLKFCNQGRFYKLCCKSCNSLNT